MYDGFDNLLDKNQTGTGPRLQVYGPCACSPLGKMTQVSQPYAPGATPVWTVYSYDGLGRTVKVVLPDGASATTYAYSGNTTTITDPAQKWKKQTMDAFGNLTQMNEPGGRSWSEIRFVE